MKNRTKLGALLAAGLLTFGITASLALAATGASDQGVTPVLHDDANITIDGGGQTDKADCLAADGVELDAAGQATTDNGVTVTMTYDSDSGAVGFTATGGVVTIAYIKGGNAYNEYNYVTALGAGVASDGNLFAPDNASGGPAGLSHAIFCTGPSTAPSGSPSGSGAGESSAPSSDPSEAPSGSPSGSGAGDTSAPSGSPTGSGAGDTAAPTASPGGGGAGATQPPTDTLGTSGSGPSDGAWLLVVALGVLLGSVVILTPARTNRRR
jgi:hypothetical protein